MTTISVTPGTITESSSNYVPFEITLDAASAGSVTVLYRTILNGTVESGDLYSAPTSSSNSGLVTFAPGVTSQTVFIRANSDTLDEFDESVVIELYNPTGADFDGGTPVLRSTGVIQDNDGAGSNLALFVSDPIIVEGDSPAAVFELRLSQPAPSGMTFTYATADGSAQSGSDYTATSGSVTFAAGDQVHTVSVPITDDSDDELAEFFSLIVTPPASPPISIEGAVGEATILDTDGTLLPKISIEADPATESSSYYMRFVVTLSEPSLAAVTVNFRTLLDGTAGEADLYSKTTSSSSNGTVTFAPGETSKDIFIRTATDSLAEADEHIVIELFDPTQATFGDGVPVLRTEGIILDNDSISPTRAMFVSDPVVIEGDAGSKFAIFTVTLSQPAATAFTASYTTVDGSATAGSDYQATTGTIDFAPGQSRASVAVPVFGDTDAEINETFWLAVTPPASVFINDDAATGEATIVDTDTSPLPEVSVSDAEAVQESSSNYLRFIVSLSEPSVGAVTVNYRTLLAGTASEPDLYSQSTSGSTNGTLTFAPGQTSQSVYIRTASDSVDEVDEHITLELFDPVGAVLPMNAIVDQASGVILDDDGVGPNIAVFVDDPVLVEGDAGQQLALFTVRLSQLPTQTTTMSFETRDGSAQAGSDYQAQSGTITFVNGQDTAFVAVPVFGDTDVEGTERFSLAVTPPGAPLIATPGAVGEATILDDDASALPVLSIVGNSTFESSSYYVRFVVTMSEASAGAVTVNYRTLLNGSLGESLYSNSTSTSSNGTLTFSPGETTKSIYIRTASNSFDSEDLDFTMELYDPVGAELAGGAPALRAEAAVLDNDGVGPNEAFMVSDPILVEGDSGTTEFVFEIQLTRPALAPFTLSYATADGTALAGEDYVATSGTIDFVPGQTTATVRVTGLTDKKVENAEFFSLNVTPPLSPLIVAGSGEATILDDDPAVSEPVISVGRSATPESSSNYLAFVVRLSEAAAVPVSVDFETVLGTASASELYSALGSAGTSGTLTFTPGQTSRTVYIRVNGDNVDEVDESVFLRLDNPVNGVLAGGGSELNALGVIWDLDGVGPNTAPMAPDQRIQENGEESEVQTIAAFRSRPEATALDYDVSVVGGTATEGVDFTLLTTALSFAPRQTASGISIEVLGDADTGEGDETIELQITPVSGAPVTAASRVITVTLGDGPVAAPPVTILGSASDDVLQGNDQDNVMRGFGGMDGVYGGIGNDSLDGSASHDSLYGGADDDVLSGGTGNDSVYGGSGNDTLNGGSDDDKLVGGGGENTLRGQGGDDTITGGGEADFIAGGIGSDSIVAGGGDDEVLGQGQADTISAGGGHDDVRGGSGNDVINGDAGNDTLYGQGNNDILSGGGDNDALYGAGGADQLFGGAGNDSLFGGTGGDTMDGGTGDDRMNGGAQADQFIYKEGYDADLIIGFGDDVDTLQLSSALVGGLSVADVLTTYADDVAGGVNFDFGNGDTLRITSMVKDDLEDDMVILLL